MKTINLELNPKSIKQAIKEVENYRKTIERKSQQLVKNLTELGVEIAKAKIVEMNIPDTGELLNSINAYYSPLLNAGFIRASCDYAVFVEFGAGVRDGNKRSHPSPELLAKANWQYGSGKTIFTTIDGRTGWFFPTKDGEWRFTEGFTSRPFMYETAIQLEREFKGMVKVVFND